METKTYDRLKHKKFTLDIWQRVLIGGELEKDFITKEFEAQTLKDAMKMADEKYVNFSICDRNSKAEYKNKTFYPNGR